MYPAATSPDFFISGFGEGHEELGGTAAVVDEPVGAGRVILFSTDPNFRAWTEGMQRVLRNALLGPGSGVTAVGAAEARTEARAAAGSLMSLESPIRITVEPASVRATSALIARYTRNYLVRVSPGRVSFVIDNPGGLSADEHPFVGVLAKDVAEAGIKLIAFRVP